LRDGVGLGLVAGSVLLLVGCASPAAVSPTTAPATPTPSLPPTAAPSATAILVAQPTAGQLANAGQAVFTQNCATCHGDQGQGLIGPALIGPSAVLTPYGTARGLYDFVSTNMPQSAPGSLTNEQYLQVVSYLLVRNSLVPTDASLSTEGLANIQLRR
jgi:mono/diheme cytochrome c family protein